MYKKSLYKKAFNYFQTDLWNKFYDTDLFAVKYQDGEIGYCCVMGQLGKHICLSVYPGKQGFFSLLGMMTPDEDLSEEEYQEMLLGQDCIQCSLENKTNMFPDEIKDFKAFAEEAGIPLKGKGRKFIHFARFKPNCAPWYVKDKKDLEYIEIVLEAALEVSKKLKNASKEELGFTESFETIPLLEKNGKSFEWTKLELPENVSITQPVPVLPGDLAKELKNFKRQGSLECKIFRIPFPIQNKKDDQPRFPVLMLCIDLESGMIVSPPEMIADEDEEAKLFESFVKSIYHSKILPKRISVFDEKTIELLKDFCKKTDTPMIVEAPKFVDDAFEEFLNHFGRMGGW